MTQEHLDDATRDASVLGFVLTTSEEAARLHMVAGDIAHEWHVNTGRTLPLMDALECARNAVAAMQANIGMAHAALDAINYRRSQPALYPEWQHVSRARAITLATLALGVWCTKGWRR